MQIEILNGSICYRQKGGGGGRGDKKEKKKKKLRQLQEEYFSRGKKRTKAEGTVKTYSNFTAEYNALKDRKNRV